MKPDPKRVEANTWVSLATVLMLIVVSLGCFGCAASIAIKLWN